MAKNRGIKKSLGIALGESSALVAELIGGDKPSLSRAARFDFPAGITLAAPESLGKALSAFLKERQFTARVAAVGISSRLLATRAKIMPPVDADTMASMLRLQAEAEFSGDLKSLTFDYLSSPDAESHAVLLVATQSALVENARALCEAAGLTVASVSISAIALGSAIAANGARDAIALNLLSSGAELALLHDGAIRICRYLPHVDRAMLIGHIKRSVVAAPSRAEPRDILLFGEPLADLAEIESALASRVRQGELRLLNIAGPSDPAIGDGSRFAAAAALALTAISGESPIDFNDSKLAPPPQQRIPRWAISVAALALIAIGALIYLYQDYQSEVTRIDDLQAKVNNMAPDVKRATEFVSRVQFAQHWRLGQARYLSCLRDLTVAVPEDGLTYATRISLREVDPSSAANPGNNPTPEDVAKAALPAFLTGSLAGKTANQNLALTLNDRMASNPAFKNVNPGGENKEAHARENEVNFSVSFDYHLPLVAAGPPSARTTQTAEQDAPVQNTHATVAEAK